MTWTPQPGSPLPPSEVRVLQAFCDGATNRLDVAERLGISVETVKTHLARAAVRLGTSGRAGTSGVAATLVAALRAGAVTIRPERPVTLEEYVGCSVADASFTEIPWARQGEQQGEHHEP